MDDDLAEFVSRSHAAQSAHTAVIDYLDAYDAAVSREHIRSAAYEASKALLTFSLMNGEES